MGGYGPDQRWYWTGRSYTFGGKAAPAAAGAMVNAQVAAALARPMPAMPLPAGLRGAESPGAGRRRRQAGRRRHASPAPPETRAAFASRPNSTRRLSPSRRRCAARCASARGRRPTSSPSGSPRPTMSATPTAPKAPRCACRCSRSTALLGDFFRDLDATGIDYVVMLTADHGGNDIPEREAEHGIPGAARADPALSPGAMGKVLAAKPPSPGPGAARHRRRRRFLHRQGDLPAPMRQRVLREAVAAYRAHPQVAARLHPRRARGGAAPSGPPETWSLIQRAKASFDPQRSGDFVVQLKPRVTSDLRHQPRLRRHPRQPVGLRPARADPVLAQGHDAVRAASVGRDGRHHADARGADRPPACRRARSTATASTSTRGQRAPAAKPAPPPAPPVPASAPRRRRARPAPFRSPR